MTTQLAYVIVMVDEMARAVEYYRNVLGLPLRFSSPGWSEFETGSTILALHPATVDSPRGTVEPGITVPDLDAFYADLSAKGVHFPMPPIRQEHGKLARFVDAEGATWSVAEG